MNASENIVPGASDASGDEAGHRPKVSVCVVTYNQRNYVGQCLQSLVDQETDFPFEVVVGDDASTDGTAAVIQKFADRYPAILRPILRPKNVGWSRNYLEIHAMVRGDYVAHMDGDDYALPGKLQAQADALDRDAQLNAVWHPVDLFDDAGTFSSGKTADHSSFPGGRVEFRDAARLGYIGAHSALMYRRSARPPADPDRLILDVYWTWEFLSTGQGLLLSDVFGRYRISAPGSISNNNFMAQRMLAIAHATEFVGRFPEAKRDFGIWALSNAIMDVARRRPTAGKLIRLAYRCGTLLNIGEALANLRRMRVTQVRWKK